MGIIPKLYRLCSSRTSGSGDKWGEVEPQRAILPLSPLFRRCIVPTVVAADKLLSRPKRLLFHEQQTVCYHVVCSENGRNLCKAEVRNVRMLGLGLGLSC